MRATKIFLALLFSCASALSQDVIANAVIKNAQIGVTNNGGGGGGITSGSVVNYKFNGTTTDSSGNGLDATVTGNTIYTNDINSVANHAIYVDGSTTISINDPTVAACGTENISFTFWFRPGPFNGSGKVVFEKGQFGNFGYYAYTLQKAGDTTQGKLVVAFEPGGSEKTVTTSDTTFQQNTWVHVGVVRNGAVGLIYTNGVDTGATSQNISGDLTTDLTHAFKIGDYITGGLPYTGAVDQFLIYTNRALTVNEVSNNWFFGPQ